MNRTHSLSSLIVMIFIITGVLSPVTAQAQSLTITQGDTIGIQQGNGWKKCTAGYVTTHHPRNPGGVFMYTAGHCGGVGSTVMNANYQHIGTVVENRFQHNGRNDVSLIELYPGVANGGNVHSGDHRIATSEVATGDQICSYGGNTHRVYCGTVKGVDGTMTITDGYAAGDPGDSGGPAWIPGKGFVGVYSSLWWEPYGEKYAGGFTNVDEYDHKTNNPSMDPPNTQANNSFNQLLNSSVPEFGIPQVDQSSIIINQNIEQGIDQINGVISDLSNIENMIPADLQQQVHQLQEMSS